MNKVARHLSVYSSNRKETKKYVTSKKRKIWSQESLRSHDPSICNLHLCQTVQFFDLDLNYFILVGVVASEEINPNFLCLAEPSN